MDKIIVLDFGGQYCHLISRRIRDAGVFVEVVPSDIPYKKVKNDPTVKGIILSGGARSVYEKNAPKFDKKVLDLNIPILGICYGHQLIAHILGGKVISGKSGEYGLMAAKNTGINTGIYAGIPKTQTVWMNHKDTVTGLPKGFARLASTDHSTIASYANPARKIFGVQFHPEVSHTKHGQKILENFALNICGCEKSWSSRAIIKNIVEETRGTIGDNKAIIGLSGGIDSSTAAALVGKAIGKNLVSVYVDTGLMRHGETDSVRAIFAHSPITLRVVKAGPRFLRALKGVISPEKKRKIIGKLFIDIFSEIAKKEGADFLIQGTIYSDRIESGITKHSSKIKSHHNVGGLPKNLRVKLYEPLRDLYKDEVRAIAKALKMPKAITSRQVFPGPGLAIRIIGEVTPERVKIVRAASRIVEEELDRTRHRRNIWMSFAVLLPVKSVGIQGDKRTYKYPIVVRIIESKDAMTANFSKIPHDILEKISTRITNEIKEVNRVVYDITNKPPGTMEWE
ncbi:MAG: glutamine-hydrolyzing GMP synthase [Candidatus Spechtbacterales bacterium]